MPSFQGPSQIQVIADTVSALAGPRVDASDIEWAAQLPAGKKLVQWLADQCLNDHVENAALRTIALEHEEVQILKHAGGSESSTTMDTIQAPLTYVTPSRLHKHAEHVDAETQLLEAETALVKSRIRQTKKAAQSSAATIKSLQAAIEREDAAISQAQDRLTELSILVDTTLLSAADTALSLLDTLVGTTYPDGPTSPNVESGGVHQSLAAATSSLTTLAALRSSITSHHTAQIETLRTEFSATDRTHPSSEYVERRVLPSREQLAVDATLLQHSITDLFNGNSLRERAYEIELQRIYNTLATEGDGNVVFDEVGAGESGPGDNCPFDVRLELEKAWALDRARLLDFEGEILDATIDAYTGKLIPGLTKLHTGLMAHERDVRIAESWVGALGLELEGVREDVERAEVNGPINTKCGVKTVPEGEDELEEKLKERLLRFEREQTTSRRGEPLVIINRDDIIQELQHIREGVEKGVEGGWRAHKVLMETLSTLSAIHHPLLTSIYRNSPLNTSPPFASSPQIARLESEANHAASVLGAALGKDGIGEEVEKVMENSRTKRKLGAFVDRWCLDSGSDVPRP
ncbi:hypothetical protein Hypma_007394 [Hypsizygus marmoreus]|uniref:Uncharacterized protein n=1 Tax=Hypsizygus marmoreus TaxID=39966 RepID=A0A369JUD9_HYPMA|nr:hypothetical protein Hypma_007394 [Hypsizygus marmoreus]